MSTICALCAYKKNDARMWGSWTWWLVFWVGRIWAYSAGQPLQELAFGIIEWAALGAVWFFLFRSRRLRKAIRGGHGPQGYPH